MFAETKKLMFFVRVQCAPLHSAAAAAACRRRPQKKNNKKKQQKTLKVNEQYFVANCSFCFLCSSCLVIAVCACSFHFYSMLFLPLLLFLFILFSFFFFLLMRFAFIFRARSLHDAAAVAILSSSMLHAFRSWCTPIAYKYNADLYIYI